MNTVHGMGVSQIMLVRGFNMNYIFQLFPVSILYSYVSEPAVIKSIYYCTFPPGSG